MVKTMCFTLCNFYHTHKHLKPTITTKVLWFKSLLPIKPVKYFLSA